MKGILIENFIQNYADLKVSDIPDPRPKNHEILIRVHAAGVNFVDLLYARGKHQNNKSLVIPPFILGLEFSGTVISAPRQSRFSPGDHVYGGNQGSYASMLSARESSIHHIPEGWNLKSSASLGATAPVSYGALILRGGLRKGETVLVHAAAGGLGLMAVQIAKAFGAKVIATASTKEKLEVARKFGADGCVDYSGNQEWWKIVLELTDGKGVDLVFDSVGLVDLSLRCLSHGGRILVVGFAGREGNLEKLAVNKILLKQARIIGYRFGETDRRNPEETLQVWKGLNEMLKKGLIKPIIFDKTYNGLDSVAKALEDLSSRKVWGKAVVMIEEFVKEAKL